MKCPKCGSEDILYNREKKLVYPYCKCLKCGEILPYPIELINKHRLDKVLAKFEMYYMDDTDYILDLGNYILVCYDNNQFYLWDDNKEERFLDISLNTVESLIKDMEANNEM